MAKLIPIFLFLFLGGSLTAQDVWSLDKCIKHAQENSLSIQQSQLNTASKKISFVQAKQERYPNLSAAAGFFEQQGRTIDPTTNTFFNKSIGSSQLSLSSGVVLFNAGRINNTIQQAKLNLEAAQYDALADVNDLALNVALIYMQILFAEDQVSNAENKLELAQSQLDRTNILVASGSLPENEKLNFEAQLATSEQTLISNQNTLDNAYLQLKQLLLLDTDESIKLARPDIELDQENPDLFLTEIIYQEALGIQPNIKSNAKAMESADLGIKIAKAQYYPSLSLSGSLSSNYSTLSKKVDGVETVIIPQNVSVNGVPVLLEVPKEIPLLVDNPFSNQINENFGQSFGLRLNIPIYQNGRTAASVQRATIARKQTELVGKQRRQTLKRDIQKAINDAKGAKRQYEAASKSMFATKAVYQNTKAKFEIGSASSFELTTARSNADMAESQLIIAKYDYLFKLKVIDYYRGKPIKF